MNTMITNVLTYWMTVEIKKFPPKTILMYTKPQVCSQ